jgi:mRNA interferase HigB
MRVITRAPLRDFAARHQEFKAGLDSWFHFIKRAIYRTPHELQQDFPTASFLGDGVTVFNIGSARLTVRMRYDLGTVYVMAVETHAEYDRSNRVRKKK